jgi:hypothetical protein
LEELADMKLGIDAATDDFKLLRGSAGWSDLSKKIAAVKTPLVRSQTAFTIPEPDLIPEGIAYDPKRRVFYLGSIHKSKIVSIDAAGRQNDFTTSGQDGLQEVLGMKVDARRRLLWVCSNAQNGAIFLLRSDHPAEPRSNLKSSVAASMPSFISASSSNRFDASIVFPFKLYARAS